MKYESFQQLIDTMDSAGYDFKKEILEIEKRNRLSQTTLMAVLTCQNI